MKDIQDLQEDAFEYLQRAHAIFPNQNWQVSYELAKF